MSKEICYDLNGERWYMYVVLHRSDIDSYSQEWWVSHTRLSSSAAGGVIELCNHMKSRVDLRQEKIRDAWHSPASHQTKGEEETRRDRVRDAWNSPAHKAKLLKR